MLQTISFIRHAKTEQPGLGESDYNRALLPRGFKDAQLTAEVIIAKNTVPEILISSGAVRALQTAEILLDVWRSNGFEVKHKVEKELYLSPVSTLFETAQKSLTQFNHAAVVAHNPGIHEAAASLSILPQHEAPTCAVFHFQLPTGFAFQKGINPKFVIFPRDFK